MKCLIQRVSSAQIAVSGYAIARIGRGLIVFVCAMPGDTDRTAAAAARKISNLRIFQDESGKMNRALTDTGGDMLVVSQFTLAADTSRGNRPGFSAAASPELGERIYRAFIDHAKTQCRDVQEGEFGAEMAVTLTNDGPVTIWLEID